MPSLSGGALALGVGVAVALCSCQRAKQGESIGRLIDDLQHGSQISTQVAAARKLGEQRAVQAVSPLIAALKGRDPVRISAARALGTIKDPRAVEPLIYLLTDMNPLVRRASVRALGNMKDPRAVTPLMVALKNGSLDAGPALVQIGEPAVQPLTEGLREAETRFATTDLLIQIGKPAVGPLIEAFQSYPKYARLAAARALAEIDDARAADVLRVALGQGDDVDLAAAAYRFLIRAGPPGSESLLRQTLHEYGDPRMAQDLYRSGKPALKAIAQMWADENSYALRTSDPRSSAAVPHP